MSIVVLNIPTINDELRDFDTLFSLLNQVDSNHSDITLDFDQCKFLRPNAVAFLGGLIRYVKSQHRNVDFKGFETKVQQNLQQNGFLYHFDLGLEPWQGNSVPYREDLTRNCDDIVDYLKEHWLGRNWVNVSSCLQDTIVTNVIELYENAFEHGQSNIGVFSCGQHYPNLKKLKLTIVDFGVGIPSNVKNFLNQHHLSSADALRWSFLKGNTTKPQDIPRRIGLNTLKEFIHINNGKLEVFSNDGYAIMEKNKENYQNRSINFKGTLANITLQCNENNYYSLITENNNQLFF